MKKNAFGEMILGPQDDPTAAWVEEFSVDEEQQEGLILTAKFVEEDDDDRLAWGCTLYDGMDNERECQGFITHAALMNWITKHEIFLDEGESD